MVVSRNATTHSMMPEANTMSTQQATTQQPLLQAIDLKKYYP